MTYLRQIIKLSIFLYVAFGLGAAIAYLRALNQPLKLSDTAQPFVINVGDGSRTIAANLTRQHILDNPRPFYVYVLLTGRRHHFYPGSYELKAGLSLKQFIDLTTDGKVNQFTVRVIEGWRINDIADEVAKKTKISRDDFLAAAPVDQYEGYLFPDTYFFSPETTASQVVKRMRDNFDRRTKDLALTKEDVVLASIVEREAKHDEDRPKIARVYLNRLAAGMPLEADPTVQYAKGDWTVLSVNELKTIVSVYNTYLHLGLPPGPIASPSLKSLQAIKQSKPSRDYYFFNLSDGSTIYSQTLEEHNANRRQYLN